MKYLCCIFDLDGTLIDSAATILEALAMTASDFGIDPALAQNGRSWIGHTLEKVLESVGITDLDRGRESYRRNYYKVVDKERPYAGIPDLLKSLHNRTLIAIATNKGDKGAKTTLQNNGLYQYIDTIVSADTYPAKPDPTSFEAIRDFYRKQGKNLESSDFLMIGDSITDFRYARNCAMDFAFAEWGFFTQDVLEGTPDYSVSHPLELLRHIEEAVEVEIGSELDLHTYLPKETRSVVSEYLRMARSRGLLKVRIVHGKGKGVQRASIRSLLDKTEGIERYYDAESYNGGLGATMVELKPE